MPTTPFAIAQLVVCIALAIVFIAMGVAHFRPRSRRVMARMIPPTLRFDGLARPETLVAFTGVCEIAGGIGLLIPAVRLAAGICLAIFLIAVFPANAYAAQNRERFGLLAVPLIPRLLGQILLIALCIFAVI